MKAKHSTFLAHDDELSDVHSDSSHHNVDHESHSHNNADTIRQTSGRVLFWCLIATFSFSIVEGVTGWFIHSIALQSDAVHMMTDAAGLMIAYFANVVARRPANVSLSFGYGKAEVLGALINCMFTTILTIWLLFEVILRFFNPVSVDGGALFIVAGLGLLVNGGIVWLLSRNADSLNIKAALIHAMGDLLGALIAIVAGAVIYFTSWSVIDPILSLVVITLLIVSNSKLIKKSFIILMAGVPEHLNYEEVGHDLKSVAGIIDVHDLHIWCISANQVALAAHVVACKLDEWPTILDECQKILLQKYQIGHVTLQAEFDDHKCKELGCC